MQHKKPCLLAVRVLLLLSIIQSSNARLLHQSKPDESCGDIGSQCCVSSQQTEFGIPQLINTCQDGLFCQEFPSANTGASLDAPSLCLPIPADTCGKPNGACCPKSDSISPCSDPNTLCILSIESGPSFRSPATGSLTYNDYLSLKNIYQSSTSSPPQQLSTTNLFPKSLQQQIMGMCTQLPAECGQPDGLCGSTSSLPLTAPQCPDKENQGCPADYFCEEQQGQRQPFSLCKPQPTCGNSGQQCCPPGTFYSNNNDNTDSNVVVHQLPFCNDATMYCAMDDGTLRGSQCRTIPAQGECGSPGQQCCPPHYRTILMDPSLSLPLPCQDGSYCNGMDTTSTTMSSLICVENDNKMCGTKEGAVCCGFTRPAGITEMSCNESQGLRCPTELLITQPGVLHSQLRCVALDADDATIAASLGGAKDAAVTVAEEESTPPTLSTTNPLDGTSNSSNSSSSSDSSNGPNTAVIVGVTVGIVAAAILCAIIVVIMKKRNNKTHDHQSQDHHKGNISPRSPKVKDTRLDENIIFVADKLDNYTKSSDETQSDKDSAFDDEDDDANENA